MQNYTNSLRTWIQLYNFYNILYKYIDCWFIACWQIEDTIRIKYDTTSLLSSTANQSRIPLYLIILDTTLNKILYTIGIVGDVVKMLDLLVLPDFEGVSKQFSGNV